MSENKAEKTQKLYKTTSEARALAEQLFNESGIAFEGEFFAHVMATYELQQMKNGLGAGYQKQISSLEYHMKSVIEHFTSMLQTEQSDRVELAEGYEGKLINLANEVTEQQNEISILTKNLTETTEQAGKSMDEIRELRKYISNIENLNVKSEQILTENKERIERLSKMVTDGQDAVIQKQELELRISKISQISDEQDKEIKRLVAEHQRVMEQHTVQLQETKDRHKRELEETVAHHVRELKDTQIRSDLETEKALVTERRNLQDQISTEHNLHITELRKLYADMDSLRQQLAEAKQK